MAVPAFLRTGFQFLLGTLRLLWDCFARFVGIHQSEEDQKRWKAVFEKKVMAGNVGLPLRLSKDTLPDFLFELESVLTGLEQAKPEAENELHRMMAEMQGAQGEQLVYTEACKSGINRNRNNYPLINRKPQKSSELDKDSRSHQRSETYLVHKHFNLHLDVARNLFSDEDETGLFGNWLDSYDDPGNVLIDTRGLPRRSVSLPNVFLDELDDEKSIKFESSSSTKDIIRLGSQNKDHLLLESSENNPLNEMLFHLPGNLHSPADTVVNCDSSLKHKGQGEDALLDLEIGLHFKDDDTFREGSFQSVNRNSNTMVGSSDYQTPSNSPGLRRQSSQDSDNSTIISSSTVRHESIVPDVLFSVVNLLTGSRRSSTGPTRRCPIDDCDIPDCLLNERKKGLLDIISHQITTDTETVTASRFHNFNPMNYIANDTDFIIEIPLRQAQVVSTDLFQGERVPKCCDDFLDEDIRKYEFATIHDRRPGNEDIADVFMRKLAIRSHSLPNLSARIRTESTQLEKKGHQDDLISALLRRKVFGVCRKYHVYVNPEGAFKKAFFRRKCLRELHALKCYDLLTLAEAKDVVLSLQAQRDNLEDIYNWKKETLNEVVTIARDYYMNPDDENVKRWKNLKSSINSSEHKSDTALHVVWTSLPDYTPMFTYTLALWQVVTCALLSSYFGLDPAGVGTLALVNKEVPTFLGKETVVYYKEPNPWLGPSAKAFVVGGGALMTCIVNHVIGTTSPTPVGGEYGCCSINGTSPIMETTLKDECSDLSLGRAQWVQGATCTELFQIESKVLQVMRPCCVGLGGVCRMVSQVHCIHIEGVYHHDKDLCSEVDCIKELCNVGHTEDLNIGDSKKRSQLWRIAASTVHCHGFIQLGILLFLEAVIMYRMEEIAGWHRVSLIYFFSSMAGLAVGCMLEPASPQEGSSAGVMGILASATLEVLQAWSYLHAPERESLKIVCLIALYLAMGTFHMASLASSLAGYGVGILASLMVLPYITVGEMFQCVRYRAVLLSSFLLLAILITIVLLFSSKITCDNCFPFECIRYTSTMCLAQKPKQIWTQ